MIPARQSQPVQPLGQARPLVECVRETGTAFATVTAGYRQFHRPRPPARLAWEKGSEDHAIGRSRGGLSTKIHAVVCQDGLPVRLHTTPGLASDKTAVPVLLGALAAGAVVADRGYDSFALRERGGLQRRGACPGATQRPAQPLPPAQADRAHSQAHSATSSGSAASQHGSTNTRQTSLPASPSSRHVCG